MMMPHAYTTERACDEQTYFAPSARATDASLALAFAAWRANSLSTALFDAVPDIAIILNESRQIVWANRRTCETVGASGPDCFVGSRPGEAFGCVHARESAGGCGTAKACRSCGAGQTIVECIKTRRTLEHECRVSIKQGGRLIALDLLVRAAYGRLGNDGYVLLVLRDIGASKRREVLERVFLHDIVNSLGGIHGLADVACMAESSEEIVEIVEIMRRLTGEILHEVAGQRQLAQAEAGELMPQMKIVEVREIVDSVGALYCRHDVARHRALTFGEVVETSIMTDPALLRRSLGNLVKNALEAVREGETVTISVAGDGPSIVFAVHNPGAMSEDVREQLFNRSFSTKEAPGRGIGLYSVKLFVEQVLGGRVAFTSDAPSGTTFFIEIPTCPSGFDLP